VKKSQIVVVILLCMVMPRASQIVSAQILGYPLVGSRDYPDAEGRRLGRMFCEDDSIFKTIISDSLNTSVFLTSSASGVVDVIKCDLVSGEKIDSLDLDCGLPSIQCGILAPDGNSIIYGAGSYLLIFDISEFRFISFHDLEVTSIRSFRINPVNGKILAICRGNIDCILEIDMISMTWSKYEYDDYENVFQTSLIDEENSKIYILANTVPSKILEIDLLDFTLQDHLELSSSYQARVFCLNPVTHEIYVAVPGTDPLIYRYLIPGFQENGSVPLLSDEFPSGFMFCSQDGNFLYVSDADSNSGLISVNLVLSQRSDRVDFGVDGVFPACGVYQNGIITAATDNRPGAIINVATDPFELINLHVFPNSHGNAAALLLDSDLDRIYMSVMNQGNARIVAIDIETMQQSDVMNLAEIETQLTMNAGPDLSGRSWWLEEDTDVYLSEIDLSDRILIKRELLTDIHSCVKLVYDSGKNRIHLLTNEKILSINPGTLQIINSVELPGDMVSATDMVLAADRERLFVGGATGSERIMQYDTETLTSLDSIPLESYERQALRLVYVPERAELDVLVRTNLLTLKSYDLELEQWENSLPLQLTIYDLGMMVYIPVLDQILIQKNTINTAFLRVNLNDFTLLTEWELQLSEVAISFACSETKPSAFFSIAGTTASLVRYGSSQLAAIKGSWAFLNRNSQIQSVNIYSYEAEGLFRLGIYNEELDCLWQSDEIENTAANEWLSTEIASGIPALLTLDSGRYLLSWQLSEGSDVPSVTEYTDDCGVYMNWPFDPFPTEIISGADTNGLWSIYADCISLEPTNIPTDTPLPSPTCTFTPSAIPTATPTMTANPSPTPYPTNTASPTATQRPGSGAEIRLNQTEYYPADLFKLDVLISNMDPVPRDVLLYLMLDIYGEYWFAPSWSQDLDCYEITGLIGSRSIEILNFLWPDVFSQAEGLYFWSAMLDKKTLYLFGYYDKAEFGYSWNPSTPTPHESSTPTPFETATPDTTRTPEIPTATPTINPNQLNVILLNDDPMTYSGENCDLSDVYCFAPERIAFCSQWNSVVMLINQGETDIEVSLEINGSEWMEFDLEEATITIPGGETSYIRVRFCPESPPEMLKNAVLQLSWFEEVLQMEIKGWGVAG